MQHHRGRFTQVVKYRGRVLKKQGQVILDTGGGDSGTHVFVDAAFGRVTLQQFAPATTELGPRRFVHRELAPGQQAHLGHGVEAALAVGVKGADAVDLIVKQIHPERHVRAHRKQVDQTAAHRVFAGTDHLGDMAVAGQRKLRFELGFVQLLLGLKFKGIGRQKARRRQAVERGGGRHQHHIDALGLVALADAPQRSQPLADQVLVWREAVVGQGLPVREQGAAQIGRKEADFFQQALGIGSVRGDDGGDATRGFFALGQLCQ